MVLHKDIALTLQKYMKKHSRVVLEHQLKSHFLKEPFTEILKSNDSMEISNTIPHFNLLIGELEKELGEINNTMGVLQRRLGNLLSQRCYKKNNANIQYPKMKKVSSFNYKLKEDQNLVKKDKISDIVLDLAVSLYKNLNSWRKVCNELAELGYLSRNNTPYTASSLSRAVSKYRSVLNYEEE